MEYRNHTNISNQIDLNLYYYGTQECNKGHFWGPAIKEHFKIHYIHKGKGIFTVGDKTYSLEQGQGFLICPNTISYYAADAEEPWTYSWIGFNGLNAEAYLKRAGLSAEKPIFKYDRDNALSECFFAMIDADNFDKSKDVRLQSLVYLFFANLFENLDSKSINDKSLGVKDIYVNKVIEFIQVHYSHKISIADIAEKIPLDPKYLTSVFKAALGVSIREYLLNYRIDKACDMMKDERLSIGDISRSIGYQDTLLFSRMFKKVKGVSPRQYRNKIIDE